MPEKTRVVRCQICYCECSGHEAGVHKVLKGHNCWELLLPVEKKVVEYTHNLYCLGVDDQAGVALTNKDIVGRIQTEKNDTGET